MENKSLPLAGSYFPFPVQLHLKPFIDKWRAEFSSGTSKVSRESVHLIEQILQQHPFLLEPLDDIGLLKDHRKFLDLLFSPVFPHQRLNNVVQAVTLPFNGYPAIVSTEAYNKLVDIDEGKFDVMDLSVSKERLDYRLLYAYKFILKKFYNKDLKVDQPVISFYTEHETGLTRYFKLTGSSQFMDVINLAPLPYLDDTILQKLLDQNFDSTLWIKHFPPEIFLFRGLSVISLIDITIEEAIARLQYNLLRNQQDENEAGWFNSLQKEMRNLFRLPGLRLGIAALQHNGKLNFTAESPLWNSLLIHEPEADFNNWMDGSLYDDILKNGKTIIVEDLTKQSIDIHRSTQFIIDSGYRNLLLAPLVYNGKMIGILELASPIPGEINGLSLFKINQVKPIFANALKQQMEVFETRVEATMLERFTSIHPAIQWRFRDAAAKLLDRKNSSCEEDIFFENVYPFYGSLDIRDSSKKRNKAIRQDLLYNLQNALIILKQCYETLSFEILGELINEIEKKLENIRASFSTGDEVNVTEFIRTRINPVIIHLQKQHPELFASSKLFKEIVCSESGVCTNYRMAYEEALLLLNRCIVNCLEKEEADLQKLYPCYFEKYRTDGVEYNIYIGSSIAAGRPFDPLYLDNLQLRQLQWTCRIMRKVAELQPQLYSIMKDRQSMILNDGDTDSTTDNVLEIAPLILAYGNPISLKFRLDEKRLDVDGSYNVRYEMLKKRIDKAVVLGTQDRLTQPGYISIVYTREQDAAAYIRHFNYLVSRQFIETGWEHLDLAPLQAAEGLKAIRAKLKNMPGESQN